MAQRCTALTARGLPCHAWAGESGYCFAHDPARRGQFQRASVKGGKRAARLRGLPPAQVASVADLLPLLARLIDDVLGSEYSSVKRARTVAALARCYSDIAQASDLERRIVALEAGRDGKH